MPLLEVLTQFLCLRRASKFSYKAEKTQKMKREYSEKNSEVMQTCGTTE